MTRNPEAARANAKLDVVAPIGCNVQACGDEADAEADHQEHEPGLHSVVELVPAHRVSKAMRGGDGWRTRSALWASGCASFGSSCGGAWRDSGSYMSR